VNDLIIVDTDILIDVGRGDQLALNHLETLETNSIIAVSAVTQMELIIGCQNKKELRITERFLERFEILRPNEQVSNIAVKLLREYRLSHGLLIADAIIAATAISFDVQFVSKNQKDYRFIERLNLLPYP
jgi:predicted nucleic acid-binding protein